MAKKFNIIACDIGANFAAASNIKGLRVKVVFFDGHREKRQAALLQWLTAYIAEVQKRGPVDVLVYERPFARGFAATRSLWGMAGIIEAVGTLAGLPVLDVANNSVKAFAAKHGKAAKVSMIEAARTMGYKGNNEHGADAVCLLRYSEKYIEIPEK